MFKIPKRFRTIFLTISLLFLLDLIAWSFVFSSGGKTGSLELYFLDVGQGDSEFIVLPGNVKILVDGGRPNSEILKELDQIIPISDNYIDLVILTHPQFDHFGGLIDVAKKYEIGAFVNTGRKAEIKSYGDLKKLIKEKNIRYIALAKGDTVKYKDSEFLVLSPDIDNLLSTELNDSSLVLMLNYSGLKALYTGDIGFNVEKYLVQNYDLRAQILKVPHHGSKFSSSREFLEKVSPQVSVIEVGKNKYGHPTKTALDRLTNIGSKIFRTDKNGTVKISIMENKMSIFTGK